MSHFDRRLTPARPDLAAAHLMGHVIAERYVEGEAMRICEEAVALSREASRECSIDTQALFGEEAIVYDMTEEGWSWVQLTRDGYVGYLPSEALRKSPEPTHKVIVPRTLVYPGPNMKLPMTSALPLAAQLHVSQMKDDFAQVPGLGFVWREHLAPFDHADQDFVTVAERFLHAPYLWGGKTISGIDCSGLVQIALQACNILSPRDTDMMEGSLGSALPLTSDLSGLQRGDLVFWKGHVGMMLNARDLLHANGTFMQVTREPLAVARERIRSKTGGDMTSLRRL
jgi:cell wall-associated NlpC family hydrolase